DGRQARHAHRRRISALDGGAGRSRARTAAHVPGPAGEGEEEEITRIHMAKSAKKKTASPKRAARPAPKKKPAARRTGSAPKPFVIDVHAHIVVPEVMEFAYSHSLFAQAWGAPGAGGEPGA